MRRCWAARSGCRRSAARWSCRFRRIHRAAATFRLKGKGLPKPAESGDLFVTTRIMLPDGNDAELEALMQKWRDGHPYNPRSDFG